MGVARRTFLTSTITSLAAPALLRLARADAPQFTFKLHHFFSSVSSAHDRFLSPWARKVGTDSGGRIRVDLFPSMQLGGQSTHLYDQARDGAADIVWASLSQTPGRFPKAELFELPFVPSRRALVSSKAFEDFAAVNLADEFREVHPICFSCADRGVIHANRPVRTIEELRGLRLEVQTRFAEEAVHALGAGAVLMPNAQLAMAITAHVVNGCVVPWDMAPALKLYDLLKAHTDFAEFSLSTRTFVLAMNKAAFDRLPPDLKAVIFNNSGQVAAGMAGAMWDLSASAAADLVAERGGVITTLESDAVAHWRMAIEPVIQSWLKQVKERGIDGGKLLASAHGLLAKYADVPEPPRPAKPAPQPEEASIETAHSSKAGTTNTPRGPQAPTAGSAPLPGTQVSAATPPPKPRWWEFWKSSVAPSPVSAAPVTPSAPKTHWWEFWKSSAAPSPVSAAPVTPPAPKTNWWEFWKSASAPTPGSAAATPPAPPAPVQLPAATVAPRAASGTAAT
jgi:TRAP-type transport system periplasmic protein